MFDFGKGKFQAKKKVTPGSGSLGVQTCQKHKKNDLLTICGHLKRTSLPKKRIIHISEVLHENAHLSPNFRFFFNISSTQAPPGGPRVQKKKFFFFDQKFFFDIYFFKPEKNNGCFTIGGYVKSQLIPVTTSKYQFFFQAGKSSCRKKNFFSQNFFFDNYFSKPEKN